MKVRAEIPAPYCSQVVTKDVEFEPGQYSSVFVIKQNKRGKWYAEEHKIIAVSLMKMYDYRYEWQYEFEDHSTEEVGSEHIFLFEEHAVKKCMGLNDNEIRRRKVRVKHL